MLDAATSEAAAFAGAAAFDPQAMLAEMAAGDPRMAMMLQMLQPRVSPADVDERALADERDTLIADLADRLDRAEQQVDRLRGIARRLKLALRSESDRLADLAAALGACGLCWGEDDHCPGCRGRGRPGMVRPDPVIRARLFPHAGRPSAASPVPKPPGQASADAQPDAPRPRTAHHDAY